MIKYGRIDTTVAKAKTVRRIVEKLVSKAKKNTNASRQKISSFLKQKDIVEKLVKNIGTSMKEKTGGSVRIRRIGRRYGDDAEMVRMDWSAEIKSTGKPKKIKKIVSEKQTKIKKE